MRVRELGEADNAILAEATLLNLNWVGDRFAHVVVNANSAFAHYARLLPSRGDFGFVAEDEGGSSNDAGASWLGVVWVLYLPGAEPGFGFVAESVAELSICVQPGVRGRGLGRRLLQTALAGAVDRGHRQLSLSVEEGNPARGLYASVGFVDAPVPAAPGTMIWTA